MKTISFKEKIYCVFFLQKNLDKKANIILMPRNKPNVLKEN